MPDYGVFGEDQGGIGVKLGGIGGGKEPKTCVWVSAVEGRAFLQRSQPIPNNSLSQPTDKQKNLWSYKIWYDHSFF